LWLARIAIYLQIEEMEAIPDFALSTYDADLMVRMLRRLTAFPFRLFANFGDEQAEGEPIDFLLPAWNGPHHENLMPPCAR
jgi:hypothetical protein